MPRRRYLNLADRIMSNSVKRGECYCWSGYLSDDGYGKISIRVPGFRSPRSFWVHRAMWELLNGPIPDGMTVDHRIEEGLCSYKSCWRQEHLRLLTVEANSSLRQQFAKRLKRLQSRQLILALSPSHARWMCEAAVRSRIAV